MPPPLTRSHALLPSSTSKAIAKNMLPPHIFELGLHLLGSEKILDDLVANSREENITYAGVTVRTRVPSSQKPYSISDREHTAHFYGLESLHEVSPAGTLNVLDIGG